MPTLLTFTGPRLITLTEIAETPQVCWTTYLATLTVYNIIVHIQGLSGFVRCTVGVFEF